MKNGFFVYEQNHKTRMGCFPIMIITEAI